MKKRLDKALLLQLVLGALGFLLNLAVVLAGYDDKNLPKPFFIPAILLLLLGLVAIAAPVWQFWGLKSRRKYSHMFTPSILCAAALAAAALGILVVSLCDIGSGDAIALWRCITGIAAAAVLIFCAWCRLKGSRPVWLCWAVVTVHMLLVLVSGYQLWSREAELAAYIFQFLACINLALFSYQQSAADAGIGSLKHYLIHSLICVALCPIAMMGSSRWMFYLGFWVYHLINLYTLNLKQGA